MKLPRRTFLQLASGAAVLPAISRMSRAQSYPARAVAAGATRGAGATAGDAGGRVRQLRSGSSTSVHRAAEKASNRLKKSLRFPSGRLHRNVRKTQQQPGINGVSYRAGG